MNIDSLHSSRHIHFIGMDGISMSALAAIMLKRGWKVSGSDLKQSSLTKRLVREGATFYLGHSPGHVQNVDIVVYTAAIRPDNPELQSARDQGLKVMSRAEFLGSLMSESRYGIAISGSHGKTTTTALVGLMLEEADLNPTVLVGGELDALGGNVKVGGRDYFVAEACEYVETFLALRPYLGVILNIDADHLDYFGSMEHIVAAFRRFAELIPAHGYLIACSDDAHVREILPGLNCRVVTYGLTQGSNWWATNIEMRPEGGSFFDVYRDNELVGRVRLKVNGRHNISNALSAMAVGHLLGIPFATMCRTMETFSGTHRRFELKGCYNGATIIDDYAHHPTEIKATLSAARQVAPRRLIAAFQPHTYTRTKSLLADFAQSFGDADMVVVTDIYASRERDTLGISSEVLVERIENHHDNVRYVGKLEDAAAFLSTELRPGDMLITMGAGDIHRVGESLLAVGSLTDN
jgi:UDP-N-acetylmuramate--alanine ligase